MPERLELKLETPAEALSPQQPGVDQGRRALPLRPAGRRSRRRGRDRRQAVAEGLAPASPASSSACADEQFSPVRKPLEQLPATNADGKADIAVDLPAFAKTSRPLEADVIVRLRESGGRTIERTRDAARRYEERPHRHQAAVQGRGGRGRDGQLRGHRRRRRRQGRPGQGPQVAAPAPGPALAVVQPRRLVGLRAHHQHAPRRLRHGRRGARRAGQDRGAARLGPLSPGGERRRGPCVQHRVQCRLLGRRERRHARGPRRGTRQAELPARRHRARQDHLAHGRPGARHRDGLRAARHAGGGPARRRRRGADQGRRQPGTPAPTSPSCSIARWTRRPSACPAARSACAGSPSTSSRAR